MSRSRWFAIVAVALLAGVILLLILRPETENVATANPEARIIAYLQDNVRPGEPVLVTDLYNNVFTKPDEQQALERLFDTFLKIPGTAADMYMKTSSIPTLAELSAHFGFTIPGEIQVLLRTLEADPRIPTFFDRDATTGEITRIYVDRIMADERFGRILRDR